ncbi:MAG: ATP-binding protein [Pseudomonadota bacterium]|nr:ATP-binding protein [Pseudomonadota bacterium]
MATSQQLKALLQSYLENDKEQFLSVALQMAAAEARKGHAAVARELKDLVDQVRDRPRVVAPVPLARPRGELAELLSQAYPAERLADLVIRNELLVQLQRVLREQRQSVAIKEHGLVPRRKLLLAGAPGTGKTLTARVLAGELGIPFFVVRMDAIVTKFMGETSAKLRQVFDAIADRRGVYLFDEFDGIGAERGRDNEVGEMRRVLNTFLQLVEHDHSDSLIIAATNHVAILDEALFRRFDDVLLFDRPNAGEIAELIKRRLAGFAPRSMSNARLTAAAAGLSHSEIANACNDAVKDAIVCGQRVASLSVLEQALKRRARLTTQK